MVYSDGGGQNPGVVAGSRYTSTTLSTPPSPAFTHSPVGEEALLEGSAGYCGGASVGFGEEEEEFQHDTPTTTPLWEEIMARDTRSELGEVETRELEGVYTSYPRTSPAPALSVRGTPRGSSSHPPPPLLPDVYTV